MAITNVLILYDKICADEGKEKWAAHVSLFGASNGTAALGSSLVVNRQNETWAYHTTQLSLVMYPREEKFMFSACAYS